MLAQDGFYDLVKSLIINDEKFDDLCKTKTQAILETANRKEFINILCVGFSPVAYGLSLMGYEVDIIETNDKCVGELKNDNMNISNLKLSDVNQPYDLVIAVDQYTTHATTADEQIDIVDNLAKATSGTLITTLRDFKNQNPNQKAFDEPFYFNRDNGEFKIFLNHRRWSTYDKQAWDHYLYIINDDQKLTTFGPIRRRTMYFKQLAKFLHDNNVSKYTVHKSPMYKGLFSRNFEYIITADFD